MDIKIVQLHKQEFKDLQNSQLILELSGKDINYAVVNTLRRLSLDYVPTYAFTKESIFIEKNTTIFNNDYMRLRLSQLTLPNINIPIVYLPEKFWKNINYADPKRDKYPDDNQNLEIYINVENKSNDILNVTTNHIKYIENNKEVESKFNKEYPSLIIQLRPNEIFKCRAIGVLGVGKRDNIWAAAGNAYYEEIDPNRYKLIIESQGQMDEYEILHKACEIIKIKLNDIKFMIGNKYNSTSIMNQNHLIIKLENEDHTIGNIMNEFLQNNKNIAFSGLSKPDLLIDEIVIKLVSVEPNPIKPLFETIDFIINLFNNIQNKLLDLGKDYITYLNHKIKPKKKK